MTYKVCYWDETEGVQKERDCTPEEVAEIEARKADSVVANHNAAIDAQIIALEARVTPRRLREAVITGDNTFIADIDAQITSLRAQRL